MRMFYEQLQKHLKEQDLTSLASQMRMSETVLKKKIKLENLTMDEGFQLIRAMQSLSLMEYVLGELHPEFKNRRKRINWPMHKDVL